MTDELYGVKLIIKYDIQGENPQTLYEEQVLKISADSFDDAYQKAENYAEEYIDKYTNSGGDAVEISLYKAVDCFKCYEEENGIQEVYSGFIKADEKALNSITSPCEAEELRILRHK